MAHSKCPSCQARVWRAGSSTEDLCPGCGGPLQPVEDLSELIGLPSLRARPGRTHQRSASIAEQIRAQIARNDAERERRADQ